VRGTLRFNTKGHDVANYSNQLAKKLNNPVIHLLMIVVVTLLSYSNSFDVPLMLDDIANIAVNPNVTDLSSYTKFFSLDTTGKALIFDNPLFRIRYIGYLSFALNYAVHGLDVHGYHLVNILIHLGCSLLVYGLVVLTFKTPAFLPDKEDNSRLAASGSFIALFSALMFAVHPLQTQAVTYVVQRFTSLATLFWMLSLVAYIQFRLLAGQPRLAFRRFFMYGLSLVATILAMKTKEFAILLPVIIALYEFMFFAGRIWGRIRYLLPIWLTLAIIPLSLMITARSGLLDSTAKLSESFGMISRSDYLFTQFRVIVTYLRLLLFPVNQIFDYDYPVYHSFFNLNVLASLLVIVAIMLSGLFLCYLSRGGAGKYAHLYRLASFGIFWFFITNSVESGFIPLPDVIFEHRQYLPSIGFILTVISALEMLRVQWRERGSYVPSLTVYALLLLAAGFSYATFVRNSVWRDRVGFMEDEVRKSPGKARPRSTLARYYGELGRTEDAVYQFKKVIATNPNFVDAHYGLGISYVRLGRMEEAEAEYKNVIALRFDNSDAHCNLGSVYSKQGRLENAIREYTIALMLTPKSEKAHNNLGNIYRKQERLGEALSEFQEALRIRPDFAEAHFNLGNTYVSLGRIEAARNELLEALKLKPDLTVAKNLLEQISGVAK
jgi:tetratricopeptide (TPR) repeat protein